MKIIFHLSFALLSAPSSVWCMSFFSQPQPHVTETSVCQGVMEDYRKLLTDAERGLFITQIDESVKNIKDRYSDNADKTQKLFTLQRCTTFLKTFPNYPATLAKAQPLFGQIDVQKAPDKSIIENAVQSHLSKLNEKEAWALFDCEPCQQVKNLILQKNGSVDKEKALKLVGTVSPLQIQKRTTRDYYPHGRYHAPVYKDIPQDQLLPESVHAKATLVQACVNIIEAKQASENQQTNQNNI